MYKIKMSSNLFHLMIYSREKIKTVILSTRSVIITTSASVCSSSKVDMMKVTVEMRMTPKEATAYQPAAVEVQGFFRKSHKI